MRLLDAWLAPARSPWLMCLVAAALFFPIRGAAFAQEADAAGQPQADQAPQAAPLRPLAPTEIANSAVAARAVLRDASDVVYRMPDLTDIRNQLDLAGQRGDDLAQETRRRMTAGGPAFALSQTEHAWQRLGNGFDGWLQALSAAAAGVDSALHKVEAERRVWSMTRDSIRAAEVPAEVTREVRETLAAVDSVQEAVRSARDTVLVLQAQAGDQKARADQYLAEQRREMERRRGHLIRLDSPPLWRVFADTGDSRSFSAKTADTLRLDYRGLTSFLTDRGGGLLWTLVLALLLIFAFRGLGRAAGTTVEGDGSPPVVAGPLSRPVAAGLLVAGLIEYMAQPAAPRAWTAMLSIVVVLAALRLIPTILTRTTRGWGYAAAALAVLLQTVKLSAFGTPVNRFALLLLAAGGVWVCLQFPRSKAFTDASLSAGWSRLTRITLEILAAVLAIGLAGNVVGAVGFATVVTTGTMHFAFSVVVIGLAAAVALGAVRVATSTRAASRLGIDSSNETVVWRAARRIVFALGFLGLASTVLAGFGVLEPVTTAIGSALGAELAVGNFSVSLGDVLVFFFVIWLSVKLSQLLGFLLGTDVLPLMHLPRGAKATIVQLTRYAVILIGVLIAFSAAGVDVDRLTVMFGALGVGVGFGLQNVVSNFASGLVALFGRTINIGDDVDFEEYSGKIREIGLLQSTVRTYKGANVLVPNSTLVSSTVVNWTQEGADRRRVDIPVGVGYGTDPETVVELLEGVATKHPQVAKIPAPKALFMEFAESSLGFQLNAWFAEKDWYTGSSDLRVQVNAALVAAGIEVAYPQRDLHLRSVPGGVSIVPGEASPASDGD